jgi:hypothetical protein
MDPTRTKRRTNTSTAPTFQGSRLCIDLHPCTDQFGKIYFVGEAIGPVQMKLRKGVFFTVFTSVEGRESIQISRLDHERAKKKEEIYKLRSKWNNNEDIERRAL